MLEGAPVTIAIATSLGRAFRSKAEKAVLEKGYDPERLPPGQYLTEKWPVLHAGSGYHNDADFWKEERYQF